MKIIRKAGDTSNILQIFIQDSSSTTGAGLTGLTSATSGLTAYYHKDTDTTATAISLVTMTVGTFTSSGFKEIDATNMPGWYQLCPPDAALSTSGTPKSVGIHLKGATNMAPLAIEIQLVSIDVQDGVHGGLSCLPNTAVTTNASLLTSGTGTDQLSVTSGVAKSNATQLAGQTITAAAGVTFPSSVASPTNITAGTVTTVTNLTNAPTAGDLTATMKASVATAVWTDTTAGDFTTALSVGKSVMNGVTLGTGLTVAAVSGAVGSVTGGVTVTTNNDKAGYSLTQAFPSNFSALGISAGGHISNVDTLTTYTGNTVQTGDSFARLGAPAGASVSADVAAIKGDTGTILTDVNTGAGAIYTRLGAPAGASMSADIAALKSDLDAGVTVASIAATASNIKKNTALNNFKFVMTDATAHTPKTGLTVTATRDIDGAGFAGCANAVTEIANGWYTINLAATDMNGNVIAFRFTATGADDLPLEIITQP